MIIWGIEDEPAQETDVTVSAPTGPLVVYGLGRDGPFRCVPLAETPPGPA